MSQQINLYAPVFRKQSKVFSAVTMAQGLGLIVLVVAVFCYAISLQTSLLETRAKSSSSELQAELERLKAYGATPGERAKALAERRKALESSLAKTNEALKAFDAGTVGRTEGYSELLRALARRSMEGVWLTRIEFTEPSGELSLAGRASRAELVPAYLERLRGEQALRDNAFGRVEVTRPAKMPYVEFTLSSTEAAK
jgi:Tfp pilus assembly protein PilN